MPHDCLATLAAEATQCAWVRLTHADLDLVCQSDYQGIYEVVEGFLADSPTYTAAIR